MGSSLVHTTRKDEKMAASLVLCWGKNLDCLKGTCSGFQMGNQKVKHLGTQRDFRLEKNLDCPKGTHSGFRMGKLKVNHSGNQMGLNLAQNLLRESQREHYWGRNCC